MSGTPLRFNVLVKKEEDVFVAHCLELDIVATGETVEEARGEMADLITAQFEYAFSNDNLENFYQPAPPEVWREFFACTGKLINKRSIKSALANDPGCPPIQIVASTCFSFG